MKIRFVFAILALMLAATPLCRAQQEKEPSLEEMCEAESDRLAEMLDLDDWQVFYVDSILKHDYAGMRAELEELQKSKVSNSSVYVEIQDRWWDRIDAAYQKLFTPEQWTLYLKQGAAKARQARERRREKAAAALTKKKK